MPFLIPRQSFKSLILSSSSKSFMNSKFLLKTPLYPSPSRLHSLHTYCPPPQLLSSKRPSNSVYPNIKKSGFFFEAVPHTNGRFQVVEVEEDQEKARPQVDAYRLLLSNLRKNGVKLDVCKPGANYRVLCPKCDGGSTSEKCLSVIIFEDKEESSQASIVQGGPLAFFKCHRGKCGWNGRVGAYKPFMENFAEKKYTPESPTKPQKRKITVEELKLQPLCMELITYFRERGISQETLKRNGVMQKDENQLAIAFTYKRHGELVSCKYRDIEKRFWQESNTEKIFYGLDDINDVNEMIIVEGEIDKLSMEEAGFRHCVSVPDGAPPKVSANELPSEDKDIKYQYLWNCSEYLKTPTRIILATDGDAPGQALAEELARRLGKERCWRVKWPKKNEAEDFKDANEVLMCLGANKLKQVIMEADVYPIMGLFKFSDFFSEIDAYYNHEGFELGVSTGWKALNQFYNVVPGELTIVSGVPNSGKSEWIDALLCNINENVGWKFVLCSMENQVREHARKLLEKHIEKPFFKTGYSDSVDRMTTEEKERGKQWLDKSFHLIRCDYEILPSISWILTLAKAAVLRYGVRGLVIDPYNELDHLREKNQTETEYVSKMLTLVKRFAQHHSVHVWFVAHPRQMQNWNGGAPNLYDISGSAHFINKCDNGIVVHRNRDPEAGPMDEVQIRVLKVRNKCIGGIGKATLSYNRITGVYSDLEITK